MKDLRSAAPPKRPRPESRALPSKDEIVGFVAREREAGNPFAGKREIARAFGIKGDARIDLKRLLKELEAEGALAPRDARAPKKGTGLPTMVVGEVTGRDRDGELVAQPSDWDADAGPAPRILLRSPRPGRSGQVPPGVGDRVLLRIEEQDPDQAGHPAYTARVVRRLDKARVRLVGVFRDDGRETARVVPVDKKNAAAHLIVPNEARRDARDGELVAVELLGGARARGPQAVRVLERLGAMAGERAVSMIAILSHDVPHVFSPEALAEAAAVTPATLEGREDWRALPLVTIDPIDARDHDDAVLAHADPDPANPGGHVVTVAIADVACLVAPGSALDRAALERGNSVYFPDRVVPMLPERISTDLGSLRPDEDRPALAVRMIVGADGRKKTHSVHRVMIRSRAKLHYAQAQEAIDGRPDATTAPLLATVLEPLWGAYRALARARAHRAPLELDLPERKLVLNGAGQVERVVVPVRLDSHRLIEEFMILANVAAAETLEARRQALVYRVHDEPSPAKLAALGEFLRTIGIKLAKGQVLKPAQFNGILERARGTEHEHVINEVVLRSQAQAEYAVENYGHFGLNLPRYAHFTSPIRRYSDLIVHRALIRALGLGRDGLPDYRPKELAEIAARISAAERRAMAAERETTGRLIAGFLADRVGEDFEGRISGVTRSGLFVRLLETGADGFIPASGLGNEYFAFDEGAHAMVGTRSRTAFALGDPVTVELLEAAPLAGALRFAISDGQHARARPHGRPSNARPRSRDAKIGGHRRSRRSG